MQAEYEKYEGKWRRLMASGLKTVLSAPDEVAGTIAMVRATVPIPTTAVIAAFDAKPAKGQDALLLRKSHEG